MNLVAERDCRRRAGSITRCSSTASAGLAHLPARAGGEALVVDPPCDTRRCSPPPRPNALAASTIGTQRARRLHQRLAGARRRARRAIYLNPADNPPLRRYAGPARDRRSPRARRFASATARSSPSTRRGHAEGSTCFRIGVTAGAGNATSCSWICWDAPTSPVAPAKWWELLWNGVRAAARRGHGGHD